MGHILSGESEEREGDFNTWWDILSGAKIGGPKGDLDMSFAYI